MGKATSGPFAVVRGKVGSIVGYTLKNGKRGYKQGWRNYQPDVTNPGTEGQQIQRAIFATVTGSLATLKPIVNHSFQGTRYGVMSTREFIARNVAILRSEYSQGFSNISIAIKGNQSYVPNALEVSRGELPAIEVGGQVVNDTTAGFHLIVTSLDSGNISQVTVREFLELNGITSTERQMTFAAVVALEGAGTISYGTYEQYHSTLVYDQIILKNSDAILDLQMFRPSADYESSYVINPAVLASTSGGSLLVFQASAEDRLEYTMPQYLSLDDYLLGAFVIQSEQTSDGSWLRSTSRMMPFGVTENYAPSNIIGSYGKNAVVLTSSDWYLNQANYVGPSVGSVNIGRIPSNTPAAPSPVLPEGTLTPLQEARAALENAGVTVNTIAYRRFTDAAGKVFLIAVANETRTGAATQGAIFTNSEDMNIEIAEGFDGNVIVVGGKAITSQPATTTTALVSLTNEQIDLLEGISYPPPFTPTATVGE